MKRCLTSISAPQACRAQPPERARASADPHSCASIGRLEPQLSLVRLLGETCFVRGKQHEEHHTRRILYVAQGRTSLNAQLKARRASGPGCATVPVSVPTTRPQSVQEWRTAPNRWRVCDTRPFLECPPLRALSFSPSKAGQHRRQNPALDPISQSLRQTAAQQQLQRCRGGTKRPAAYLLAASASGLLLEGQQRSCARLQSQRQGACVQPSNPQTSTDTTAAAAGVQYGLWSRRFGTRDSAASSSP